MGLILCATVASVQAQKNADASATISLGAVSGTPGGQVTVPLMLTSSQAGSEIGGIETTVAFETKFVSFVRAEKGFLLDRVGGVIETRENKNPDQPNSSRLQLQVVTKGQPRKGFVEGLILALLFDVKPNAIPGTVVPLKLQKVSLTDLSNPPKVLRETTGRDGSITVTTPEDVPIMPCFFFAH